MSSRERVVTALNHQEPDRVPLDIGGGSSTSIVIEGYETLKKHWNITQETQVMNKIFRLACLPEEVMQRLGSDCRPLGIRPPVNWTPPPAEPGFFVDMWGISWREARYGNSCLYWELAGNPLAEASIEDLEDYPWPDVSDPGYTAGLAEEAEAMYTGTDYALVGDGGFKSFWELGYFMRGLERSLMDLVLEPDFIIALMTKLLEINKAVTGRYLDAVGPYIQVFRTADDLATQQGPLMSPQTFRSILKPFYKEYIEFVKTKTDAKIFYHSCGNVVDLIDDLVDVGVDILNPVQVSALCDTAELKARFGNRMCFWGGIDTQHALPYGSVEDVAAEVRKRILDLGPGGGYVVGSVHNIQPDVPPENIIAMAEATHKYGQYPLAT